MQEQDLSEALLLYDDINRKGFEGDLVINGFAEFIRNLLVCKDEKAAVLLEVVESFKDKYISTAKQVSPPLLISALNILNETEINYKTARNKRLHVELAIIKLCYLQQAIQISADGTGIAKKKVVEGAKSIAFRQIRPFGVKESIANSPQSIVNSRKLEEAKLIIETPESEKIIVAAVSQQFNETTKISKPENTKISPLDKIRQQYQATGSNGNGNINLPIQLEDLQNAWAEYVLLLKAAKNPAAQPFLLAILRIKDENTFEVVSANNIEKQFIEQDRNKLFVFLQERLKNKSLQFSVIAEEKSEDRPMVEIPLSAKEQFLKMAEQYPLIKELKDRLRLELDY